MNRPKQFEVLVSDETAGGSTNLMKLAEFSGIAAGTISLETFLNGPLAAPARGERRCLGASVRTLANLINRPDGQRGQLMPLLSRNGYSHVYVYGLRDDEVSLKVLAGLLDSSHTRIVRFDDPDHRYRVTSYRDDLTMELSGLDFGPVNPAVDYALAFETGFAPETVISIGNLPHFVTISRDNCTIFLHAVGEHLDLEERTKTKSIRHIFSQFAPFFMFLRHVFGDQCWHSRRKQAALIIDDPYLRPRYGFVNMAELLRDMDRNDYAATIAFIPWNYKRTARETASLFTSRKDRLSICVHGCDHTAGEFGTRDSALLHEKMNAVEERMLEHTRTTGIPWDKTMVFPQGIFSDAAMSVLKEQNYIAAVNSTPFSIDALVNGLTYRDILDVAVMDYASLPLFSRRYTSKDVAEFRIDAFLNKPLLAVEHHDFFRDGFDRAREFARRINAVSDRLEWRGLSDLLLRTHLRKLSENGAVTYRMYGTKAIIDNASASVEHVTITKKEKSGQNITGVFADGERIDFKFDNGVMECHARIESGCSKSFEITNATPQHSTETPGIGLCGRSRVWARRRLCDLRDNYLCRNRAAMAVVNLLRRPFVT